MRPRGSTDRGATGPGVYRRTAAARPADRSDRAAALAADGDGARAVTGHAATLIIGVLAAVGAVAAIAAVGSVAARVRAGRHAPCGRSSVLHYAGRLPGRRRGHRVGDTVRRATSPPRHRHRPPRTGWAWSPGCPRSATVAAGEPQAVDGQPVLLLYGAIPLYRTLKPGRGPTFEANLRALGFGGLTVDQQYTDDRPSCAAGSPRPGRRLERPTRSGLYAAGGSGLPSNGSASGTWRPATSSATPVRCRRSRRPSTRPPCGQVRAAYRSPSWWTAGRSGHVTRVARPDSDAGARSVPAPTGRHGRRPHAVANRGSATVRITVAERKILWSRSWPWSCWPRAGTAYSWPTDGTWPSVPVCSRGMVEITRARTVGTRWSCRHDRLPCGRGRRPTGDVVAWPRRAARPGGDCAVVGPPFGEVHLLRGRAGLTKSGSPHRRCGVWTAALARATTIGFVFQSSIWRRSAGRVADGLLYRGSGGRAARRARAALDRGLRHRYGHRHTSCPAVGSGSRSPALWSANRLVLADEPPATSTRRRAGCWSSSSTARRRTTMPDHARRPDRLTAAADRDARRSVADTAGLVGHRYGRPRPGSPHPGLPPSGPTGSGRHGSGGAIGLDRRSGSCCPRRASPSASRRWCRCRHLGLVTAGWTALGRLGTNLLTVAPGRR